MGWLSPETLVRRLRSELDKYVIGQGEMKDALCRAVYKYIVSDKPAHLLIVGDVGLGKTLATEVIKQFMGKKAVVITPAGEHIQIKEIKVGKLQGTEDTTDADVIGDWNYFKLDKNNYEFDEAGFKNAFNKGLLLKYDIVLIQEINRIPYRTQNAILEVMSDNQVTIGAIGKTLKRKVLVIATMNDRDLDETYSLSRAICDRFSTTLRVNYPTRTNEFLIIRKYAHYPKNLYVPLEMELFIVQYIHTLRNLPEYITVPPSPRGTIALLENTCMQALLFNKHSNITVNDVRRVVVESLAGRINISYKTKEESAKQTEYEAKAWILLKIFDKLVDEIKKEGRERLAEGINPDFSEDKYDTIENISQNQFQKASDINKELTSEERNALRELLPEMTTNNRISLADEEIRRMLDRLRKEREISENFDMESLMKKLEENDVIQEEKIDDTIYFKKGDYFFNMMAYRIFIDSLGLYDRLGLHLNIDNYSGKKVGYRKYKTGDSFKSINKRMSARKIVKKGFLDISDLVANKFQEKKSTTVMIVLDISGSMKKKKLYTAKVVAAALARFAIDFGDKVGLVVFSNHSEVVIEPTKSLIDICKKLAPLKADSCTNIVAGIEDAVKELEQSEKGVIIVLSDGEANMLDEKWERLIRHQGTSGYHSFLYWRDKDIKFALSYIKGAHQNIDFFFVHIASESQQADYCRDYARVTNGHYAYVILNKYGDVKIRDYLRFRDA